MATTVPEMPKEKMVDEPALADSKDEAARLAAVAVLPSLNAAVVMSAYSDPLGALDLNELALALQTDMAAVLAGDLSRLEAMLYSQAHALQSMFMSLACRAKDQDCMKNCEAFMRLALKAQSQCRATIESLATIKNPSVVFAQQANINNGGQQQVNNTASAPTSGQDPHAPENAIEPNKLLERPNGERMDIGKTGKASRAHPRMAAVGAIKRSQERGR